MTETSESRPFDWRGHDAFTMTGSDGEWIPLRQVDEENFVLPEGFTLEYRKATGLDRFTERGRWMPRRAEDMLTAEQIESVKTITGEQVEPFNLASVPGVMRWFVRAYGDHTPAAIFHDHLIGTEPNAGPIPDVYADRYFRYQLGAVGVPRLRRYIMWAATAMRSRWARGGWRQVAVGAWAALAIAGLSTFVLAVLALAAGWTMPIMSAQAWLWSAAVLPFVASLAFGRQYGAGIVAAIAGLWIVPPAVVAWLGLQAYKGLEKVNRGLSSMLGVDP